MKLKKLNGFTLIELLSIMVVLAIIAVITIPIIYNIIENSRKSAASASALGYKDAINNYYFSGITTGSLVEMTGNYDILNGSLINSLSGSSEQHNIQSIGTIPKSGNIDIIKGELVSGCVQIDSYAVVFSDSKVSKVEKKDCIHAVSITASNVSYVPPEELELNVSIENVQQALQDLYSRIQNFSN